MASKAPVTNSRKLNYSLNTHRSSELSSLWRTRTITPFNTLLSGRDEHHHNAGHTAGMLTHGRAQLR
eukprot:8944020-Heterocapsa_arctica.AAC.2